MEESKARQVCGMKDQITLTDVEYEGRFTPPVEDHQLDKMTVMMLEMMGIKVEPKALLQYSANNERENEYGLYM